MPTYIYECPCGQIYDVTHSIHEDPEVDCDHCGQLMNRVPAPIAGIKFNGSGWYANDKNK